MANVPFHGTSCSIWGTLTGGKVPYHGWSNLCGVNPVQMFTSTIASGVVSADLTEYPVKIDLSNAPINWWNEVARSDGGDIRAESSSGDALAFDLVSIDTTAKTGVCVVKSDVSSSSSTSIILRAYNDSGMSKLAVDATNGQYDCWDMYAAVYLYNGNINDRTSNGRDLTWVGTGPVYSTATGNGAGGGLNTTAAAGYGHHADATLDGLRFSMFGVAERNVENTSHQMFMGMIDTLGSNTDRQLLGNYNVTDNFTYLDSFQGFIDSGVSSGLGDVASMGANLNFESEADSFKLYINGTKYVEDAQNLLSDKTIIVSAGRGTSNTDWRGNNYISLFRVGTNDSDAWQGANDINWRSGGLMSPPAITQAWTGVAS